MRFLYVAVFVLAFAAALLFFKHVGEAPNRPEMPVTGRVELYVPGMT